MNYKGGVFYGILKAWIKFFFTHLLYKKVYYVNREKIMPDGTPQLIVSDHQNCLVDAIAVVLSFGGYTRKPRFWSRADIFNVNKYLSKFLYSLGITPAYRMEYEGLEAVGKNQYSFQKTIDLLTNGQSVMLFPEAGHQDKRYLGHFSLAYLRIAFDTAKQLNYEKDIYILPSANHYTDYFKIREEMCVIYSDAINLRPFYEKHKVKPRTTIKEVNAIVREKIESMMLNITDLDNYKAIDFIRTNYSDRYASLKSLEYNTLPNKLTVEKEMVAELDEMKNSGKQTLIENIYSQAKQIADGLEQIKLPFRYLRAKPSKTKVILLGILLLVLLPLWLVSLWPHIFIYNIPKPFNKRMKDKMLTASFLLGISCIITIPLFYLISFIAVWCIFTFVSALIYLAILPLLAIFCYEYTKWWDLFRNEIKFMKFYNGQNNTTFASLKKSSENLEDRLWSLFRNK